ncbi:MAG: DNA-processing protein DprA [Candidatus Omnitrophica bacterium]|nr:DNA-processing protein DprA [Candidatus Omnitrophota bacterium]
MLRTIHMSDTERLLILNMVEDLGSVRTQALLKHFGSLARVFRASEDELKMAEGIGPKIAPKIVQSIKDINIDKELGLIKQYGIKVITFLDRDYPKNLKNIYDPPVVLYVKGEILPEDDVAISIVGSRLASFYGRQTSEKFGYELASRGITVVSGLARGIDSSAHKGALKAKGRTLAVLGSGLLNIYPEEHRGLADEISERGAVISEFPMRTIPDHGNFPKRNRVISGLSLGTVVVEAAQKSGALITADCALEQGRDVFSVPGKVDSTTSKGTNKLIKQGAKLAETVHDVLEELRLEDGSRSLESRQLGCVGLDKRENIVYNLLSSDPQHIDELCEEAGMGISDVSRILLNLEMKRFVRQLPGKTFVKV